LHYPDRCVPDPAADWVAAKILTVTRTTIYREGKWILMIVIPSRPISNPGSRKIDIVAGLVLTTILLPVV
jgi:hypothetical protein